MIGKVLIVAVCNKCNLDCLNWKQIDGNWRLHDGDSLHDCGKDIPCPTPNMGVAKPTMTQRNVLLRYDEDMHNEHLSRIQQCNDARLLTMVLGDTI